MNQNDYYIGPPRNWLHAGNRELLFGLLALTVGLFAANMLFFGGLRLGFAIGAVLSLCLSWGYLHRCGHKGGGYSNALFVLGLVIAAGFGWSADGFVKGWMLLFLVVGANLSFCLMAGQNRRAPGSARSLMDAARTFFDLGIGRIAMSVRGITVAFRSGGALTQRSGAVLAGLGIAVPALAVVIPLLISSDAAFEGLVGLLPDFDLFEIFLTVFFGTCFGLFLYSRAVALHCGDASSESTFTPNRLQVLTMNTALGAVCVVYLAYLFSQLAYFVGGFSGILPEGYTAAEYARRGFFEMAWLVAINLGLMTFGVSMVQRQDRAPAGTRALCLFLGLVSEFLVAAGVAKMVLYIGLYGLTRLRVLTMVIMIFLALTTALVALWLYLPKLQYMKAVMLLALSIGAAVMWLDVDTQVAKYNVEHYLSGDLAAVDLAYLSSLGPGAVESMEQLARCDDPAIRTRAIAYLRKWELYEAEDFRQMTYLHHHAQQILDQWQPDGL